MNLVVKKLYLSWCWTVARYHDPLIIYWSTHELSKSGFVVTSCFFPILILSLYTKIIAEPCFIWKYFDDCRKVFYLRSLPALLILLLGPDTPPPSPQLITLILTQTCQPVASQLQIRENSWITKLQNNILPKLPHCDCERVVLAATTRTLNWRCACAQDWPPEERTKQGRIHGQSSLVQAVFGGVFHCQDQLGRDQPSKLLPVSLLGLYFLQSFQAIAQQPNRPSAAQNPDTFCHGFV